MSSDEKHPEWHEEDRWWEGTAQVLFTPEAWEHAPQQVEQVLALTGLEPPVDVLDLPCGVGRHTLELARLSCSVTAVDRTALYLEQAKVKANEAGLEVEFVEADMRAFRRQAAFDLAINLFTSFGYFEDYDDDLKVLANFHASLRPGGTLVMDMASKEVVARIFQPRDWHELEDGTLVLQERRIDQDWTWIENRWIIIHDGERRDYPVSHRLYGASDLRRALAQTGFTGIQIYGSLVGTPYDHTAQRLVAVAHKPSTG